MYTRFKSQKSGLKLGMNSLANTTTTSSARVAKSTSSSSAAVTPTTNLLSVNSMPNGSSKSQLMSSSTTTATTSGVGSTGSSIHHSSASSSTVSLTPSSSTQSINTLVNNLNSVEIHHSSDSIVLNADIDFNNNEPVMHLLPFDNKPVTTTIPLIINDDSDSHKAKSKKMAKLAAARKSPVLVENIEEPIDFNSITYVQSKWEKVKSEMETESGPQRYPLNDNSQYPHLSNFVAFDLENWWTERVFSSMISNQETQPSKTNMTNETSNSRIADVSMAATNFKLDSQFLMSATARLTNSSSSYLKNKTTLNQDLIMNSRRLNSMDSSLRYFGNFQSCFS